MMDGAGTEILQDRRHEHGENECKARRGVAGKFACEPRYSGEKRSAADPSASTISVNFSATAVEANNEST